MYGCINCRIIFLLAPKQASPQNLTIVESPETFSVILMWAPPVDKAVAVAYYQVQYK